MVGFVRYTLLCLAAVLLANKCSAAGKRKYLSDGDREESRAVNRRFTHAPVDEESNGDTESDISPVSSSSSKELLPMDVDITDMDEYYEDDQDDWSAEVDHGSRHAKDWAGYEPIFVSWPPPNDPVDEGFQVADNRRSVAWWVNQEYEARYREPEVQQKSPKMRTPTLNKNHAKYFEPFEEHVEVISNPYQLVFCTWNIRRFGSRRWSEEGDARWDLLIEDTHLDAPDGISRLTLLDVVAHELLLCDITAIQETEGGINRNVIQRLTQRLDDYGTDGGPFGYQISDALGPTKHKERYAFIYRKEKVEVSNPQLYPNGPGFKNFDRRPYFCRFKVLPQYKTTNENRLSVFALGNIHTKPNRMNELDNLDDVFNWAAGVYGPDIMIMGDYNAGETYVKAGHLNTMRIAERETYHWFIEDNRWTSTRQNQGHDRMVSRGPQFRASFIPESAHIHWYPMTKTCFGGHKMNREQALRISDHLLVSAAFRI